MAGSVLALTVEHGRLAFTLLKKSPWVLSRDGSPVSGSIRQASALILSETEFHAALYLEHRRTQRCKRPFLFMRAAPAEVAAKQDNEAFLVEFGSKLAASSREGDIFGWEKQGRTLGAAFTEVGRGEKPGADARSVAADFIRRRTIAILKKLPGSDSQKLILSFQFFAGTADFSS